MTVTQPAPPTRSVDAAAGLFGWWREGTPEARTALVAASLGWISTRST